MTLREIRLRALSSDPLAFGSTFAAEGVLPDAFWFDRARLHASGSDAATLFAASDGRIDGLIVAVREAGRPDVFAVYSVWVAPDGRGKGVGASLLRAIEEWIVANGGSLAELFVSSHAPAAERLYRRAGYVADGRTEASPHAGVIEHGMRKELARRRTGE